MNPFNLFICSSFLLFSHAMPNFVFAILPQENETFCLEKYVNTERGYSIEYPSHWIRATMAPKLDMSIVLPCPQDISRTCANMSIVSEYVGESMTLDEMYSTDLSYFSSQEVVQNSGEIDLNGIPSKWIFLSVFVNHVEVRIMQYYIFSKGMAYVITFGALPTDFSENYHEFEEIMYSFRLL